MSARKSKPVKPTRESAKGKLFVGVITAEQQRKMRKAQERLERIQSGLRQTGSGSHGGGKREQNRRNRKQAKREIYSSDV